jgi:hypothetical protein
MTRRTHEFELIHTFSGVPMNESLSSVHGRELISNTFEEGLDAAVSAYRQGSVAEDLRSRVTDEGRGHLESSRSNVTVESAESFVVMVTRTHHWAAEMFPGIHSTK